MALAITTPRPTWIAPRPTTFACIISGDGKGRLASLTQNRTRQDAAALETGGTMLRYELRINARAWGEYGTLEEALHRVKAAIVLDPDLDPEIIDRRTGRACMIAASKRWRDEIAERLGA